MSDNLYVLINFSTYIPLICEELIENLPMIHGPYKNSEFHNINMNEVGCMQDPY